MKIEIGKLHTFLIMKTLKEIVLSSVVGLAIGIMAYIGLTLAVPA
jgi:hypothetical protein